MRRLRGIDVVIVALMVTGSSVWGEPPESPVESALVTLFSPQRAPREKTMGLLQRSFLDLAEESRSSLEIAFVIDGTSSMGESLIGVQQALSQMLDDLALYKSNDLAFQLVIFRDEGAPSGAVSFPLQVPERRFTHDREALRDALQRVEGETGAPYFPELVDVGLHSALRELNWSDDPDKSRWVFLFTDAPPFDPNFAEEENEARRHVDTQLLVDYARQKGIKVNCVLCTSREKDRVAYERGLDQARDFMNQLASGTEGVMLDLSYPDIRRVIEEAARKPLAPQARVGTISRRDIDAARRAAAESKSPLTPSRRLKLAVLPYTDLDQAPDRASDPAVQFATEMREIWRRAGADVANPRLVTQAMVSLRRRGIEGEGLVQAVAQFLKSDYVVWGRYDTRQGTTKLSTAFFSSPKRTDRARGFGSRKRAARRGSPRRPTRTEAGCSSR